MEKMVQMFLQMFHLETHQYLSTINAPEFWTVDGTEVCCLMTDRGEIASGNSSVFPGHLFGLFFPTTRFFH